MEQVARQFQATPIGSEESGFCRIDIGHQNVEDTSWPQPFRHLDHDSSRLAEVLEHVEARDDVEGLGWERSVQNVAHKNLSAALFFRDLSTVRDISIPWSFHGPPLRNSKKEPELQPKSRRDPPCLYWMSAALRSRQRTGES